MCHEQIGQDGTVPTHEICIDMEGIGNLVGRDWDDPSCDSIAEQHPESTQHVVDGAGGVLEANPITATTNALGWTDTSQFSDRSSGWFIVGQSGMAIFNAGDAMANPTTALGLTAQGAGAGVVHCFRQGFGSADCRWAASTLLVGGASRLQRFSIVRHVDSFFTGLSSLMGGVPDLSGC